MAFLIPENLRSRRDIPAAISMMARALADSLDFGATVWYEPLFDVSGQRPDLVVLIPDAGVLVLEVLQEKRSSVAVHDGQLVVTAEGKASVIEDPLRKAERFAEAVAERVAEAAVRSGEQLPVVAAAVFAYVDRPSAEAKRLAEVVPLERCLLREHLDAMASAPSTATKLIARLMAAPLRDAPISPETERVYRAVIHPDTVLTSVQGVLPGFEPVITRDVKALDREQESLAKTLGAGHRVIRGVAGSGKTVILVHRARLLARTDTRSRILVTCYNRSLAGYLGRQLKSQSPVRVRTLGAQLARVLTMAGEHAPDWKKESLASVASRATDALDGLVALGANVTPELFDHVLVDEAQDFPPGALRFATRMLRDGSDSLLVVTDAAQSLYSKGFTWKEAGIDAAGRTKVLRTNYRNTRQVLEWAWSFLSASTPGGAEGGADPGGPDSDVIVPPEAGLRDGPLPLLLYSGSPDEEVLQITALVGQWLEEGVPAGDIGILYGARNAGGYPWVAKLQWSLEGAGVPHYWPTDPDDPAGKSLVGAERDKVLISTIHSAKGLEFPNVIVCGYLDDKPPEELAANRRLVYVGMTRATNRLVLTASGRHEYIADLERGPVG